MSLLKRLGRASKHSLPKMYEKEREWVLYYVWRNRNSPTSFFRDSRPYLRKRLQELRTLKFFLKNPNLKPTHKKRKSLRANEDYLDSLQSRHIDKELAAKLYERWG